LTELHRQQETANEETMRQIRILIANLAAAKRRAASDGDEASRLAEAEQRHRRDAEAAEEAIAVAHGPALVVDGAIDEHTSSETAAARDANGATAAQPPSILPEALAHFQAIYALPDERERVQLSRLVASMPSEALDRAEDHLAQLTPSQAVEYLRSHVFPSARVAA
jgi:hypothetical protein